MFQPYNSLGANLTDDLPPIDTTRPHSIEEDEELERISALLQVIAAHNVIIVVIISYHMIIITIKEELLKS